MQNESDYNELAQKLYLILKEHIHYPQAILKTQFKRINKTVLNVSQEDLQALATQIGKSVANFTNPNKGREVEKAISELIKG